MKTVCLASQYVPAIRKAFENNGFNVIQGLTEKNTDEIILVFSINFDPAIAKYCQEKDILYFSWIVDCPHTALYSTKVSNVHNIIFLFDYQLFCRMEQRESDAHFFYLPLAAAHEEFEKTIQTADRLTVDKYSSDISFLGRLYCDEAHAQFDQIKTFSPYIRGYLESMMDIQHKLWGIDIFRESISASAWKQIDASISWDLGGDYQGHEHETIMNMLNQKLAQKERIELCNRLCEKYDFALYTQDDTSFNSKINNRGYIDYMQEMPLVFANSKINVNVTLRSISSGIPLRCMDILGCGGFLLTNYQPEIVEYFEDGVDLVIYSDFDDLEAKIDYYLAHEEERVAIAHNGREKVIELFNYEGQISKMLSVLEEE